MESCRQSNHGNVLLLNKIGKREPEAGEQAVVVAIFGNLRVFAMLSIK